MEKDAKSCEIEVKFSWEIKLNSCCVMVQVVSWSKCWRHFWSQFDLTQAEISFQEIEFSAVRNHRTVQFVKNTKKLFFYFQQSLNFSKKNKRKS